MTLASRKTYQKLSSNGLDLTELEPKAVDHRHIPILSVARRDQGRLSRVFGMLFLRPKSCLVAEENP
jgi:hypothetical protein